MMAQIAPDDHAPLSPAPVPEMGGVVRGILAILTPRERRDGGLVAVTILVLGVFETAAVGAIAVFARVLARPDSVHELPDWLVLGLEYAGYPTSRRWLFVLGLGVFLILVAKSVFAAFATWMEVRFVWARVSSLSRRLLERYLGQPYEYFLGKHSVVLGKNILVNVDRVVGEIIRPAMRVLSEGVVAGSIVALLAWYDAPLVFLILTVCGGGYTLVYWATGRRLERLGRERFGAEEQRARIALEGLGGIKEVKAFGMEGSYLRRYEHAVRRYIRPTITEQTLAEWPRFAVDIVSFGAILGILLLAATRQADLTSVLAATALYAAAGFRLMPCVNRLSAAMASLRAGTALLTDLHHDLVTLDVNDGVRRQAAPRPFTREIELENVIYRYPDSAEPALAGISLAIRHGSSAGIVGATGSGKSTLVDVTLGILSPDEGQIRVDGAQLTPDQLRDFQATVGYVPQHVFLADDTVERNIAFGVPDEDIDRRAVTEAAELAGVASFVTTQLSKGYQTMIGERGIRLSGGQRQRLGIARALYRRPSLVVLDEATNSLDSLTEADVTEAIRSLRGRVTLIVVAHRLATIQHCDVVYVLERGRLVAEGNYEHLVASNDVFRRFALHEPTIAP